MAKSNKTPKDLKKLLSSVIKEEHIDSWVNRPNERFDGKKPIDMWRSASGKVQIQNMVAQLEHGVFS